MKKKYIHVDYVINNKEKNVMVTGADWAHIRKERGLDYSSPEKYIQSMERIYANQLSVGKIFDACLSEYESEDICMGGVGDFCKESQFLNEKRKIVGLDYDSFSMDFLGKVYPEVDFITCDLSNYDFESVPDNINVFIAIGTWYNFDYETGKKIMTNLSKRFKTVIIVDSTSHIYSSYYFVGVLLQFIRRKVSDNFVYLYQTFSKKYKLFGYVWERNDYKRLERDCNITQVKEIPVKVPNGGTIRIFKVNSDTES